jgi:deoxyribodipyrimidine photo-lyase
MRRLPIPTPELNAAEAFVAQHLGHLVSDEVRASSAFVGGQRAADAALAAFDVAGYAGRRNEVWPTSRRGASRLSPYIRHGLLHLSQVWEHVAGGPRRDVEKFRDELLWQEYARHWYARLGTRTVDGVRHRLPGTERAPADEPGAPDRIWPRELPCFDLAVDELDQDGWLVNQQRMWLAGHWSAHAGAHWRDGEDHFFRHLLDGSRAANRLGWQWVTGAGSSKAYLFSRWQVERRSPGLCAGCPRRHDCPIEDRPSDPTLARAEPVELMRRDPSPEVTAGPAAVVDDDTPTIVWLTAESLGHADPALAANPDLTAVFVFDETLLASLRLSSKRLVFLTETLVELASERPLELWLGDPVEVLDGHRAAVTFAPVPGFRARAERISPVELHPWPWLRRPGAGPIGSFSAWRRSIDR